jgi:hypothetical protein
MLEQVLPLTGKSSSNCLWQSPSDDETAPRSQDQMVEGNCEVLILAQYSTQTHQLHALNSVGNKDPLEYSTHTKYKETFQCLHHGWSPILPFLLTYNSE